MTSIIQDIALIVYDVSQNWKLMGYRKVEDNKASADPLSFTTNGSWVDLADRQTNDRQRGENTNVNG